jgi:hypothetical protein
MLVYVKIKYELISLTSYQKIEFNMLDSPNPKYVYI